MIAHIALPQIDSEEIKPLKDYRGGDSERGAEIVDQKATIPATLSEKVQTELLRKDMGFKGLIVTDAMSMLPACKKPITAAAMNPSRCMLSSCSASRFASS